MANLKAFFDAATNTVTYLVWDPHTRAAAVIDPVLDFDPNGARLATPQRVHFVNHRFRCTECACEFCGACGDTPYHLGHTCEQWAEAKRAPHCRFCESVLSIECACAATT